MFLHELLWLVAKESTRLDVGPVACRGLVMPGAIAWLDAPLLNSSIEQWCMVVIVTEYTLLLTSQCDVIFGFATHVLAKFVDTTCIFSGAGAAVGQGEQENILGQWKLMKNKKIVTNDVCFCSSTMLTSRIITEIIENHSELFGCSKSCNDYVSIRSW